LQVPASAPEPSAPPARARRPSAASTTAPTSTRTRVGR
jgi:hypothetical protein